jgi:hypothetical protein
VLDDDDLLKAVIDSIHTRTGRVIGAAQARQAAADILAASKHQVGNPVTYVTKAIRAEKDPARRWLDADPVQPPLVAVARPPWCGECDETTRMLDMDTDQPRRCPQCKSPKARAS